MQDQLLAQAKLGKRFLDRLEARYPDDPDLKKLHAVAAGALQIAGITLDDTVQRAAGDGEAETESGGVDKVVLIADPDGNEPVGEGEEP